MFGAIYIGLSGLNAYSKGLQQVSNNVTNLNTTGFKGSTVTFQNFYGAGDLGGLSYHADSKGAGNGVGLADQRLDLKQGELRQTDRDLDLAVDGTGFMVLMKDSEIAYTRTGSFDVDKDGFIVLAGTDYRLATVDSSGRVVSLSIDGKRTSAPATTTAIKFANNLSADATAFSIPDLKVHDASGQQHVWSVKFERFTGDEAVSGNVWKVSVTDAGGGTFQSQTLKFLPSGEPDPATAALTFTRDDASDAVADFTVSLDFSGASGFPNGDVNSLSIDKIDGYGMGALTTVAVNAKGEIELGYSNEQKVSLGAIAIADFRDPQSLEQKSGGLFTYTGTGELAYLKSDDPRVGQVLGKRLEASNVDLSKEFGDLILIQRGFQASSQIVSVSNDMIQQLFGIRGQG
jgi:flagellar hook protein FlgE